MGLGDIEILYNRFDRTFWRESKSPTFSSYFFIAIAAKLLISSSHSLTKCLAYEKSISLWHGIQNKKNNQILLFKKEILNKLLSCHVNPQLVLTFNITVPNSELRHYDQLNFFITSIFPWLLLRLYFVSVGLYYFLTYFSLFFFFTTIDDVGNYIKYIFLLM